MIEYIPFAEKISKWLYGYFTQASISIDKINIELQTGLKVARAYIKNTGKVSAKNVEANLTELSFDGKPVVGFIESPLWWMHNQFKDGDKRKNDIPSESEKPLDIVNIINNPEQNLLILSCREFIGDHPFVFLRTGLTSLRIEFTSDERRLGIFQLEIQWDGTDNVPTIKLKK